MAAVARVIHNILPKTRNASGDISRTCMDEIRRFHLAMLSGHTRTRTDRGGFFWATTRVPRWRGARGETACQHRRG